MAKTYDIDGSESSSIPESQNKKKKKLAMKPYELESIKRQYSGKNYTIEDKKNVINYYKKKGMV